MVSSRCTVDAGRAAAALSLVCAAGIACSKLAELLPSRHSIRHAMPLYSDDRYIYWRGGCRCTDT
eukprot:160194-Pleurochrysis_carterae.AAC.1